MKKNFSRKFFLRLFSLFFSFFIWLYVVSSAEVEIDKVISLSVETPEAFAVKNSLPKEVIMRLRGPRLFVQRFIDSKEIINIRASDYYLKGKSNYSVKLDRFYPKTPLGIEVISKNVRSINLQIEKKARKRVPIVLSIPDGARDEIAKLDPVLSKKYVYVEGAKSLVRKINKVRTETLELSDVKNEQIGTVQLELPLVNVQFEFLKVELRFKGLVDFEEFTYANIPIIFQSEKLIKTASTRSVDIRVYGSRNSLKKTIRTQIRAVVEVNDKNKNEAIAIQMNLPEGLELRDVSPKTVRVKTE